MNMFVIRLPFSKIRPSSVKITKSNVESSEIGNDDKTTSTTTTTTTTATTTTTPTVLQSLNFTGEFIPINNNIKF